MTQRPDQHKTRDSYQDFRIRKADFNDQRLIAMLKIHHATVTDPASNVPGQKMYALDLASLQQPNIHLWTVWSAVEPMELLGLGALKVIDSDSAEVKSMHTSTVARGKGTGAVTLEKLLDEAKDLGLKNVYLETGSLDSFAGARRFYAGQGFVQCGPFADYEPQENSYFMCKALTS